MATFTFNIILVPTKDSLNSSFIRNKISTKTPSWATIEGLKVHSEVKNTEVIYIILLPDDSSWTQNEVIQTIYIIYDNLKKNNQVLQNIHNHNGVGLTYKIHAMGSKVLTTKLADTLVQYLHSIGAECKTSIDRYEGPKNPQLNIIFCGSTHKEWKQKFSADLKGKSVLIELAAQDPAYPVNLYTWNTYNKLTVVFEGPAINDKKGLILQKTRNNSATILRLALEFFESGHENARLLYFIRSFLYGSTSPLRVYVKGHSRGAVIANSFYRIALTRMYHWLSVPKGCLTFDLVELDPVPGTTSGMTDSGASGVFYKNSLPANTGKAFEWKDWTKDTNFKVVNVLSLTGRNAGPLVSTYTPGDLDCTNVTPENFKHTVLLLTLEEHEEMVGYAEIGGKAVKLKSGQKDEVRKLKDPKNQGNVTKYKIEGKVTKKSDLGRKLEPGGIYLIDYITNNVVRVRSMLQFRSKLKFILCKLQPNMSPDTQVQFLSLSSKKNPTREDLNNLKDLIRVNPWKDQVSLQYWLGLPVTGTPRDTALCTALEYLFKL